VIYYTDKGGHERDIGPGDPRPEVAYAASKRLLKMAGVKVILLSSEGEIFSR
jgi:hypothetical protein